MAHVVLWILHVLLLAHQPRVTQNLNCLVILQQHHLVHPAVLTVLAVLTLSILESNVYQDQEALISPKLKEDQGNQEVGATVDRVVMTDLNLRIEGEKVKIEEGQGNQEVKATAAQVVMTGHNLGVKGKKAKVEEGQRKGAEAEVEVVEESIDVEATVEIVKQAIVKKRRGGGVHLVILEQGLKKHGVWLIKNFMKIRQSLMGT